MSATKVALAGLAALAGPMIYAADPVRPVRATPVSAPQTIAEKAERPATVHVIRPGVRVILASPFDPPGTRQEAAATAPAPGVPESLVSRNQTADLVTPTMRASVGDAPYSDEQVVRKARKKARTASRPRRGREPAGFFQAAPFFAWLR